MSQWPWPDTAFQYPWKIIFSLFLQTSPRLSSDAFNIFITTTQLIHFVDFIVQFQVVLFILCVYTSIFDPLYLSLNLVTFTFRFLLKGALLNFKDGPKSWQGQCQFLKICCCQHSRNCSFIDLYLYLILCWLFLSYLQTAGRETKQSVVFVYCICITICRFYSGPEL